MTDALIVVDVQNLFVELVGAAGLRVVREVNRLTEAAEQRGDPIFYTRDYAPVDLPDSDPDGRIELHRDLHVRGPVVLKGPGKRGGFSGFVHTPVLEPQQPNADGAMGELVGLLRACEAGSVTVVGIAADVCVAATARDALRLGYPTRIRLAASAFVHAHPGGDAAAIAELRADGIEVTE